MEKKKTSWGVCKVCKKTILPGWKICPECEPVNTVLTRQAYKKRILKESK